MYYKAGSTYMSPIGGDMNGMDFNIHKWQVETKKLIPPFAISKDKN